MVTLAALLVSALPLGSMAGLGVPQDPAASAPDPAPDPAPVPAPVPAGSATDVDQLHPLTWSVDERGQTLAAPGADGGEAATPLFGRLGGADGLDAALVEGGLLGHLSRWMTGPRDVASQTDAEWHFSRLGLGLDEAALRARITAAPALDSAFLQRRAELDRLLAVRLAGQRKVAGLQGELARLAVDRGAPWDLRRAASEASLAIVGQRAPSPVHALEPLESALALMPAEPTVLLVIRQDRVQDTGWILARARPLMVAYFRQLNERMGFAPRPDTLAGIQRGLERTGELPYELARRFGNLHVLRTVLALEIVDRDVRELAVCLDGRLEPERVAAGLEAEQVEVRRVDGAVRALLPAAGVGLSATDSRLVLRSEALQAGPPAPLALDDAALLLQLRDLPEGILPGPIRRAELLTLRLWMAQGLRAVVTAVCESPSHAGEVAELFNAGLGTAAAMVGAESPIGPALEAAVAVVDGQTVTVEVRSGDLSLEAVLQAFFELSSG